LAVRAAVLMIGRIQEVGEEGRAPLHAVVRRGAADRLPPVATTGAALALLVLPFVAFGSRPGLEVIHPMAVVLLGGIVTTLAVTLFVLPALCARVAREPTTDESAVRRWPGLEGVMPPEPAAANGETASHTPAEERGADPPAERETAVPGPAAPNGEAER